MLSRTQSVLFWTVYIFQISCCTCAIYQHKSLNMSFTICLEFNLFKFWPKFSISAGSGLWYDYLITATEKNKPHQIVPEKGWGGEGVGEVRVRWKQSTGCLFCSQLQFDQATPAHCKYAILFVVFAILDCEQSLSFPNVFLAFLRASVEL